MNYFAAALLNYVILQYRNKTMIIIYIVIVYEYEGVPCPIGFQIGYLKLHCFLK